MTISMIKEITANAVENAEKILKKYGVDGDETDTVVQAVGYALLDTEFEDLEKDNSITVKVDLDDENLLRTLAVLTDNQISDVDANKCLREIGLALLGVDFTLEYLSYISN